MIEIEGAAPISDGTCHVIAEAGQCMEGSADVAISMAQQAANAGAWGFKVQILDPDKLAHRESPKYWDDSFGTRSQREAFAHAGLVDRHLWKDVKQACDELGIVFFATPFDYAAVDLLEELDVKIYKIASGDITYHQLLSVVAQTGKPIMLSTGAAVQSEVEAALDCIGPFNDVIPLACTLAYPTPSSSAHIGRIEWLRHHIKTVDHVGYSDHTLSPITAFAAAACGAALIEKHYTTMPGGDKVADHAMAVSPLGLSSCVAYAQLGASMRGAVELEVDEIEEAARINARRSIYAAHDLSIGKRIGLADVDFLRPGIGSPPTEFARIAAQAMLWPRSKGDLL